MICLGGAVSHSLFICGFPGTAGAVILGLSGGLVFRAPPALAAHAACQLGGTAWLDPQCGEWATDGRVHLCTGVPPLPPTHLPSVCEINVVFVWVNAASVALLCYFLSWREGKQACRPQSYATLLAHFCLIHIVSALDRAGSWVGEEGC